MKTSDYMFGGGDDAPELTRLQNLEAAHDPLTFAMLRQAGISPGKICADIGAGAGSVARYMAEQVGGEGRVDAVDLDQRFLGGLPDCARQVTLDITKDDLGEAVYDIIHARFLLIHLHEADRAVDAMWRALKPGGALVLEDANFHAAYSASPDPSISESVNNVGAAVLEMFRGRGLDPGFGLRIPSMLDARGAESVVVETSAPLVRGGTPMGVLSGESKHFLRKDLIATGLASEEDVAVYHRATHDPLVWGMYHCTVSVLGLKPRI